MDLVHVSENLWLLGRWTTDRRQVKRGQVALQLYRDQAAVALMQTQEGRERYRTARLQSQGFRPMYPYRIQGEPTSEIVSCVQRGTWEIDHLSDAAYLKQLDDVRTAPSVSARAALRDEYAAKEFVRFGMRRPVSVTVNGNRQPKAA